MELNQLQDKSLVRLNSNFNLKQRKTMKKLIIYIIIASALLSCNDLVDFKDVQNPNLAEENVLGQPNSSSLWLTGMERQLSIVVNEIVINAEIASDNYVNTQTFYNQFLDALDVSNLDNDVEDLQFAIHRLRAMANNGIDRIGPADETYSPAIEAEYWFMMGMTSLWSGMYFKALPNEEAGVAVSSQDNLSAAISQFNTAIETNSVPEYHIALARTYYLMGNKAMAVASAEDAIAAGADVRAAGFDEANGPGNIMESALYERGTFDDLQPLPSLDFLDPKYSFLSTAEDYGVNYLKVEEAHLILAEAAISDGDVGGAQTIMTDLIGLVATRPLGDVDDSIEGRTEIAPGSRPDSACVVVNGREGLVLERGEGNVMVPIISGTSLVQADIDGMDASNALYLLYRTRQEIFISEGMRMVDMGVKFPVGQTEQLLNENINLGDGSTTAQIPAFMASAGDIDAFTYDPDNCTATITVDVTQILIDNQTSDMVLPFH